MIKFRGIIQCGMLRKLLVVQCGMECLCTLEEEGEGLRGLEYLREIISVKFTSLVDCFFIYV